MSQMLSSAYVGLASLLKEAGHIISPSELQATLVGRACAGVDVSKESLQDIELFLTEGELTEPLQQAVGGLRGLIQQELAGDSIAVTLLLPDDETDLEDRLRALSQWGHGFLSGFGLANQAAPLSKECKEILEDVASIAQLDTSVMTEDEARSEGDYMELVEYLRVIPVLLYTELKKESSLTVY